MLYGTSAGQTQIQPSQTIPTGAMSGSYSNAVLPNVNSVLSSLGLAGVTPFVNTGANIANTITSQLPIYTQLAYGNQLQQQPIFAATGGQAIPFGQTAGIGQQWTTPITPGLTNTVGNTQWAIPTATNTMFPTTPTSGGFTSSPTGATSFFTNDAITDQMNSINYVAVSRPDVFNQQQMQMPMSMPTPMTQPIMQQQQQPLQQQQPIVNQQSVLGNVGMGATPTVTNPVVSPAPTSTPMGPSTTASTTTAPPQAQAQWVPPFDAIYNIPLTLAGSAPLPNQAQSNQPMQPTQPIRNVPVQPSQQLSSAGQPSLSLSQTPQWSSFPIGSPEWVQANLNPVFQPLQRNGLQWNGQQVLQMNGQQQQQQQQQQILQQLANQPPSQQQRLSQLAQMMLSQTQQTLQNPQNQPVQPQPQFSTPVVPLGGVGGIGSVSPSTTVPLNGGNLPVGIPSFGASRGPPTNGNQANANIITQMPSVVESPTARSLRENIPISSNRQDSDSSDKKAAR